MEILFLGGMGVISSTCTRLAVDGEDELCPTHPGALGAAGVELDLVHVPSKLIAAYDLQ